MGTDAMDRPTVLLTRHDVLSILTGIKMGCSLSSGEEVWVRLYTVDEFLEANAQSRDHFAALGCSTPEPPSRARAETLVEPVPEHLVWGRR